MWLIGSEISRVFFFNIGSVILAALNEKRNCLSVEMVPTRFIQSKVRVTSLNKDQREPIDQDSPSVGSESPSSDEKQDSQEKIC